MHLVLSKHVVMWLPVERRAMRQGAMPLRLFPYRKKNGGTEGLRPEEPTRLEIAWLIVNQPRAVLAEQHVRAGLER